MAIIAPISPDIVIIDVRTGKLTREGFQILQAMQNSLKPFSGDEETILTGTAGAANYLGQWDANGDLNGISPAAALVLIGAQPLDADLTSWAGVTRAAGFDTFTATPSSANLKAMVTDETGSGGALVFATGPTIASPVISGGSVTAASVSGTTVQATDWFGTTAPRTVATDFTVGVTDNYIISNRAATNTGTLPVAASFTGRVITIQTYTAQTVVSASSNVVPRTGGAAGTAILAATAGAWALLVSDGTSWVIMAGS